MPTQKFEIRRTGNFWIDLGTVALWNYFATQLQEVNRREDYEEMDAENFKAKLARDSFVVEGEESTVNERLQDAVDFLEERVWGETRRGRMWWKGCAQFFFQQQKNPNDFLSSPQEMVKSKKWRAGICDFCGHKGEMVKSVGTSEIPFIVVRNKFMTFYPNLKRDMNICVACTFASRFALLGIFFNITGDVLNASIMEGEDLLNLSKSLYYFGGQLLAKRLVEDYRNYKSMIYHTQHTLESFLDFLLFSWSKFGEEFVDEEEQELSEAWRGKLFHVFQARKDGKVVTFEHYYIIPDVERVFQVFNIMKWQDRDGKEHNALQHVLNNFYFERRVGKRKEIDTILREDLCRRILYGNEIFDAVENFLYKSALVEEKFLEPFVVLNFKIFVEKYEEEVIGLEEVVLRDCESVGSVLGSLAASTEDKGVLYTLRSIRSLDDFLESLHQILVRYADELDIYRERVKGILREINEKNWKRYRALIGIYAVLEYMKKKREEEKGKEKEKQ